MFEILKGHDSGASFWIQPVKVLKDKCIGNNDVTECPEEETEKVKAILQEEQREAF